MSFCEEQVNKAIELSLTTFHEETILRKLQEETLIEITERSTCEVYESKLNRLQLVMFNLTKQIEHIMKKSYMDEIDKAIALSTLTKEYEDVYHQICNISLPKAVESFNIVKKLRTISNPGMGDCMYYSLSDCIDNVIDKDEIRFQVVNHIVDDWERFKPFAQKRDGYAITTSEEYKDYMGSNGTWGDHLCLIAFSEIHMKRINIMVYKDDVYQGIICISEHYDDTIQLKFTMEFHYEALK